MAVQIPLPWQLTDFLCALGLGALYGAVYRWGRLLLPMKRLHGRTRRVLTGAAELLWALGAAFFTRAWVLTGSRAAQLRWTAVLGIFIGLAAFRAGLTPVLDRLDALILRLFSPLHRLLKRIGRAADARRKRRKQAVQKRRQARAARRKTRRAPQAESTACASRSDEKFSAENSTENTKKELQSVPRLYYNNL